MPLLKRGYFILLFVLPLATAAQKSAHFGAPKYVPADDAKLLIVGQDLGSVGGLNNYNNGYIDNLGHIPAGITTYTGLPGLAGLNTKANWGAGDIHANAYTSNSNFDQTTIVIGLHLVGQLKNIIEGKSDYPISVLGSWIKNQNRPIFLRIGYEFDGPWNNYNPVDFKAAWTYLVHAFDDLDIRNVAYVWQSAGINTANLLQWYPGDEYVNWVGYSHFNELNPGQTMRTFASEHDKPIMIAEATPKRDLKIGSGAAHWDAWFAPLFKVIYEHTDIKALAYINADWDSQSMWQGQGWGDSRIEVNETVKSNWLSEVNKDIWLASSADLFELLKYEIWQDSTYVITAIGENNDNEFTVAYSDGILQVSSAAQKNLEIISIYDFTGKELYRYKTKNDKKTSGFISKYQLNKGVIVNIIGGDKAIRTLKILCD